MSSSSCPDEGLRVLVVDDEELACRNLRRKLTSVGGVAAVEVSTDPVEAVVRLRQAPPDLLLLDVVMPGLSGFELLAQFPETERPFVTVFCTAHDEHAARAFEAAALDYLVKPVDPRRLGAALARARRFLAARPSAPASEARSDLERARAAGITGWLERLVVRSRSGARILELAEVLAISSEAHCAVAYTRDSEHVLDASVATLEPQLAPRSFARCHRAHLVRLSQVIAVEDDQAVLSGGRRVPVSRRCRSAFLTTWIECRAQLPGRRVND